MALKRKKFEYDDDIKDKEEAVKALLGSKPTFNSENSILSKQALDAYMNYPEFSYDVNKDALFNQYSDKYTRQGKMAMQDTMGQAAALTGGYGNSWAQTAGQQVYQGYMQELADKVPELQQIAYGQHQDRKNDLLTKYGLYSDLVAQDYSRHRDEVADHYKDLGITIEDLASAKADAWNRYTYNEGMDYQLYRDDIEDKRYEEETAYNRKWNEDERAYTREWNEDERAYTRNQNAIANANTATNKSIEYAMSLYDLTGDPTQLNSLTGMDYPVLDKSSSAGVKSLNFKDYNNIADAAYKLIGENGDTSKAENYIRRLVDSNQVSPEDGNDIAAQLGLDVDFLMPDTTGWVTSDYEKYFEALLWDESENYQSVTAEIDSFMEKGKITKDQADEIKNYIYRVNSKGIPASKYRK